VENYVLHPRQIERVVLTNSTWRLRENYFDHFNKPAVYFRTITAECISLRSWHWARWLSQKSFGNNAGMELFCALVSGIGSL
jgi:Tfp pilus assembly pilus retraction ATPase PilT